MIYICKCKVVVKEVVVGGRKLKAHHLYRESTKNILAKRYELTK